MASITLTNLRAWVREAADMTNSQFVNDDATSLDFFINKSLDRLYGLIVDLFEDDYFASTQAFSTVANTETVALPATCMQLTGVDLTIGGGRVTLLPFQRLQRNMYRASFLRIGSVPRYRVEGTNIRLLPAPTSVLSGVFLFIPNRTVVTAGVDTNEIPNGWEEWAVADAAIKCLGKEESEVANLVAQRNQVEKEMRALAASRDIGSPAQVVDVDTPFVDDEYWG